MFFTLFYNIFTLFLMMVPGYILVRRDIVSKNALKDFSQVIIKVFYPCLIFSSMTRNYTLTEVLDSWQLPVSVFLILLLGYGIGLLYVGFFKTKDLEQKKSILFQLTINNYSFLPLAIIAKLYDEQHMAALILSTLGAEITVWTLGMSILNRNEEGFRLRNLKKLLAAPLVSIYFSLLLLVVLYWIDIPYQQVMEKNLFANYLNKIIYEMGQATIPLSMVMIGGRMGQISFGDLKSKEIWMVTLFRLVIIPFVAVMMVLTLFPNHPFVKVMLIVAVMPNAIASLVFGELYGADQKILSGTVLISHLVALVTIPLWLIFLI